MAICPEPIQIFFRITPSLRFQFANWLLVTGLTEKKFLTKLSGVHFLNINHVGDTQRELPLYEDENDNHYYYQYCY